MDRQIRLFTLDAARIAAELAKAAGLPHAARRLRGLVLQGALIAAAGGRKAGVTEQAIAAFAARLDAQQGGQGGEQGGEQGGAIAAASVDALRRGAAASKEIRQKALGFGRAEKLWETAPGATSTPVRARGALSLGPWRSDSTSAAASERSGEGGERYVGGDDNALATHLASVEDILAASLRATRQPRLDAFIAHVAQLQAQLETRLRLQLTETIEIGDPGRLLAVVDTLPAEGLTLDAIAAQLPACAPLAASEVARLARALGALRELQRSCAADAASSPWHAPLFVDASALALGIFEGLMQQIASGFAAVRRAERLLAATAAEDTAAAEEAASDEFFRRYDWTRFSDEEWALCPPVVVVGDAPTLCDSRLQSLSRLLMSGKPVKVLMLDDLAPEGVTLGGKELGLIAVAHRQAFVLQSTLAHREHLLSGFADGLKSRSPALFRVFAPPRTAADGTAIDVLGLSRLAVASRAFPLYRYDPQAATVISAALSIAGNPEIDADWSSAPSCAVGAATPPGAVAQLLTGVAYGLADPRFAGHFAALPESVSGELMPLAEYLALPADEREGITPYLAQVDAQQRSIRLGISPAMIAFAEDRLAFWRQLRSLACDPAAPPTDASLLAQIRDELLARAVQALD